MRTAQFFGWGVLFCLLTGIGGVADTSEAQLVTRSESGSINWTNGVVEAKGTVELREAAQGSTAAWESAFRDAKKIAARNLLNTVRQIRIDADMKISDLLTNNEALAAKLKLMVQSAETIGPKFVSDGTVEVTMKMGMTGKFAEMMLPPEIKRIEPIRPIRTETHRQPESATDEPQKESVPASYTGLVIDARSLCLNPALAPRVVDENGDEVFGPSFASREFAVQAGMTGYATDLTRASTDPRVMNHPLILKGLKTAGFGYCNIVVSLSDAGRLKSNFNHLTFLKNCRVIIVIDSASSK